MIYYGNQDSNATTAENGAVLKARIEEIIKETGAKKLNVLAHSKGGLDMRYAISTLGMGKYVASLTTLSTPHHGSQTVDLLLRFPRPLVQLVAKCSDLCLRICGDKKPDAYAVFHGFTTKYAEAFNQANPDDPKVYYQSYGFVMNNPFSDILMWFPNLIVGLVEGKNDGLLAPRAVQWTNFRGIYTGNSNRGISHCDEVDMRRHRLSKKDGDGVSDIVDFYVEIVRDLKRRGF